MWSSRHVLSSHQSELNYSLQLVFDHESINQGMLLLFSPLSVRKLITRPLIWSPWNTRSAYRQQHLSFSQCSHFHGTKAGAAACWKLIPCRQRSRVARQSAFFAPNTNILHFHYIRTGPWDGGWWLLCSPARRTPLFFLNQPTLRAA